MKDCTDKEGAIFCTKMFTYSTHRFVSDDSMADTQARGLPVTVWKNIKTRLHQTPGLSGVSFLSSIVQKEKGNQGP